MLLCHRKCQKKNPKFDIPAPVSTADTAAAAAVSIERKLKKKIKFIVTASRQAPKRKHKINQNETINRKGIAARAIKRKKNNFAIYLCAHSQVNTLFPYAPCSISSFNLFSCNHPFLRIDLSKQMMMMTKTVRSRASQFDEDYQEIETKPKRAQKLAAIHICEQQQRQQKQKPKRNEKRFWNVSAEEKKVIHLSTSSLAGICWRAAAAASPSTFRRRDANCRQKANRHRSQTQQMPFISIEFRSVRVRGISFAVHTARKQYKLLSLRDAR